MIKDYIEKERDYIREKRRYFHMHPETSLHEFNTARVIEEELSSFGIPHERVGETGIYAVIDGKKAAEKDEKKRIIALRADIDALPMDDLKTCEYHSQNKGVCHACGHDGHTATLLAAAKVLKEKENEFSGRVKLFFQQAEEIGAGARLFVKAGLLDDVQRVYGAHVCPKLKAGTISLTKGPMNASCDYFKITIKGKGAHVSTPELGKDALYIASQTVNALQSIVSRGTSPLDTVVVGVGRLEAGTAYNIVAEDAVMEGTTRTFTPEIREKTNRRVKEIAEATAAMYGAEALVEFKDFAAPLINDGGAVDEVTRVTERIIPAECIIHNQQKALGADDFADYLAVTKGMYAFLGTNNEVNPDTAVAQHNGHFDIDEESLLLSCNVYVDYALAYLNGEFD